MLTLYTADGDRGGRHRLAIHDQWGVDQVCNCTGGHGLVVWICSCINLHVKVHNQTSWSEKYIVVLIKSPVIWVNLSSMVQKKSPETTYQNRRKKDRQKYNVKRNITFYDKRQAGYLMSVIITSVNPVTFADNFLNSWKQKPYSVSKLLNGTLRLLNSKIEIRGQVLLKQN